MIEGAQEGELATQVFGTDQWLEFVGHLHPLVLHMPIGLLAASLLLAMYSSFARSGSFRLSSTIEEMIADGGGRRRPRCAPDPKPRRGRPCPPPRSSPSR